MCYRGGRGVVPTAGIRPGRMIVKFRVWPRDIATQMRLWHIVMAEPLHKRHHLPDDMQVKAFFLEKRCKKTSFFSPFQKIQTNGVKSGRFLHRLVRSRGCLGQASGQVLHGHLHDSYRITLKISHLNRWQYEKRVYHNAQIERFTPATDNRSRGDFFKKRSFDTPSFPLYESATGAGRL